MQANQLEQYVTDFQTGINLLQKDFDSAMVDVEIEFIDDLMEGDIQIQDGLPTDETIKTLKPLLEKLAEQPLSIKERREVFQLITAKVLQNDHVQSQHQLTPTIIGELIASMIERLMEANDAYRIWDPQIGSGNLLLTVAEQIPDRIESLTGTDQDETMVALSASNARYTQHDVLIDQSDVLTRDDQQTAEIVLSDLPMFFEQDGELKTEVFDILAANLKLISENGFGFFLVNQTVLQNSQFMRLLAQQKDAVYLQGAINLSAQLFTDENLRKSLLIFQAQGDNSKQTAEVLLGNFPSLSDAEATQEFLNDFSNWGKTLKKEATND